jgi:hypothetical protein
MSMSLTNDASQFTMVEQARAVAEVAASVQAAKADPRDENAALNMFLATCSRKAFADRAYWRFRRSGEQLVGVTIDFAEEAARCWGNMTSGSVELARHDDHSQMLAFAWDLQTNYQRRIGYVNPHTGYTDNPKFTEAGDLLPPRKLIAVRDIREGNQSTASRVEREAIIAVIPSWFIEAGKAQCDLTIKGDSAEPIEDKRRKVIAYFEATHGVTMADLVDKLGLPVVRWNAADLAVLRVIDTNILRGETTVESQFRTGRADPAPPGGTRIADVVDTPAAPAAEAEPPAQPVDDVDTTADPAATTISRTRMNEIFALMTQAGLAGRTAAIRAQRLRLCEVLVGHRVATSAELTEAEGVEIAATLRTILGADNAADAVRALIEDDTTEDAPAAEAGESETT